MLFWISSSPKYLYFILILLFSICIVYSNISILNIKLLFCNSCPLYFCPTECDGKCDQCSERSIERAKQYCDRYEPFDANKHNPEEYDRDDKCINYDYHMDDHFFRIEEVDVIE